MHALGGHSREPPDDVGVALLEDGIDIAILDHAAVDEPQMKGSSLIRPDLGVRHHP
jgi:hypothetical protein